MTRLRRLKRSEPLRALVRETSLDPGDLCWPLFVAEGLDGSEPIPSLAGQSRHGLESLLRAADQAAEAGIAGLLLFGVPATKDDAATSAWREDGIVQRSLRALKGRGFPLVLLADTCLCQYKPDGHCGLVVDARVDNDSTLPVLARVAASQAAAGADVVAPSDMMDGRVAAIRGALDAAGHEEIAILSYAVKHASAYYGPFREAADSAPASGDRRSHQLDPANRREARRAALRDVAEGADAVMVKPALACLDLVRDVRELVDVPVAAYSVSGEHAMIEAAARARLIDRDAVLLETLGGMRRAGADFVVTYHALEAASILRRAAGR